MSEIIINVKNDDCCICLSPLDARISVLECEHQVHTACMVSFLKSNCKKECPLCKKTICEESKDNDLFGHANVDIIIALRNQTMLELETKRQESVREFITNKKLTNLYTIDQVCDALHYGLQESINEATAKELEHLYSILLTSSPSYMNCDVYLRVLRWIDSRKLIEVNFVDFWELLKSDVDYADFVYLLNLPEVLKYAKTKHRLKYLRDKHQEYYDSVIGYSCVIM